MRLLDCEGVRVLGCEAIDPDSDPDSDTDLDETMKDMKLHENQEFPLAFQKNPSSAIPCVLWLNNRFR